MESNALSKLFTAEEQSELKESFKTIICEHLRNDLENMDCYLFEPSRIEDMIDEVISELKDEMKDLLRAKLTSFIDNSDVEKLLSLKKKVK